MMVTMKKTEYQIKKFKNQIIKLINKHKNTCEYTKQKNARFQT